MKFSLTELKKASIRLQNNKFSLKNIRLKVYERVEILVVEVYEKIGKSVNSVCKRT